MKKVLAIRQPMTARQVAVLLNTHPTTLSNWARLGLPNLGRDEKRPNCPTMYDIIEVQKWINEQKKRDSPVEGEEGQEGVGPVSKPLADLRLVLQKIRSQRANADRLELEVRVRRGDLLERAEVEEARGERIAAVKAVMFSMPAKLAPMLVGRNQRTIQRALEDWARSTCDEFSREPAKRGRPKSGAA